MHRALLAILVALMCMAGPVGGQSTFGSIVGVVHDGSEGLIAGASLQIRSLEDNSVRSTTAGTDGSFEFVNATRQGRPGQNPYVQSFRHVNQFALDRPLNEAVLDLQPDELCPASKLRQSICLSDPPSGSVRGADVQNLSLANEVIQAPHDLFHRRDPIPDVHPVQVDGSRFSRTSAFSLFGC
jgi:hypothetical protein